MIRLSDGRFVAAVRLHDKQVRTSLCWIDPQAGTLAEFLKLPSGEDTSYAGLVMHEDLLCVSYYSSHEGKTNIYLAKVKLPLAARWGKTAELPIPALGMQDLAFCNEDLAAKSGILPPTQRRGF